MQYAFTRRLVPSFRIVARCKDAVPVPLSVYMTLFCARSGFVVVKRNSDGDNICFIASVCDDIDEINSALWALWLLNDVWDPRCSSRIRVLMVASFEPPDRTCSFSSLNSSIGTSNFIDTHQSRCTHASTRYTDTSHLSTGYNRPRQQPCGATASPEVTISL